jgi:hypothetical protein
MVALAGACLAAITPFFWRGNPSGHDFEFHVFSWMEVLGQWKHGIAYPRWAALAHWGYGEARFLFYPPASWTLGGALGAVLPWKMVPGAYCWIVLVLAGMAMYRLARRWLPARDAMFAALFYALNPYHLLIVYWRSAYAELLAGVLLPLLLLCLLRLNEPGVRPTLWLGLTLAAAWLTNVPAAVMIHYSAVGLALVIAATGAPPGGDLGAPRERLTWGESRGLRRLRPLVRTSMGVALGAGLASFYLLPAIYEQRWINLSEVLSPGVRPQDNFLFTIIADPDHNRFNFLVSTIALSEITVLVFAMWFSARERANRARTARFGGPVNGGGARVKPRSAEIRLAQPGLSESGPVAQRLWMVLAVWGTGSALFMLSVSNLLWQHLPRFRFVQLPFRWLLCMNAGLSILLATAAKRWSSRVLVSAALLATLIFTGYYLQPPWWATAADVREMNNFIAEGSGYEGTDEYVPAGADPYELNKNFPLVADGTGAPVKSEILAWGPEVKHFVVRTLQPERLELRLLNYPAWQVVVNGQPAEAQTAEGTGQMIIPIREGTNDVLVQFRRTIDRTIGDGISFASLMLLAAAWITTRSKQGG